MDRGHLESDPRLLHGLGRLRALLRDETSPSTVGSRESLRGPDPLEWARADLERQDRPAVLLYAGDFDPSGEDIDRDFVDRVAGFADVRRIALVADQIERYQLPPNPGKATDSRAQRFSERHGQLVQVELDALDPSVLRTLYQEALDAFWDTSAFHAVLEEETTDRAELTALAIGGSA